MNDLYDRVIAMIVAEPMTDNWLEWYHHTLRKFDALTVDLDNRDYDAMTDRVHKFLASATHEEWAWAGVYNYAANLW